MSGIDEFLYSVEVTGKLGDQSLVGGGRGRGVGRGGDYQEDVFMSLEEVVQRRGIIKPPSYKSKTGDENDDLPITGGNSEVVRDFWAPNGARQEFMRIPRDPRGRNARNLGDSSRASNEEEVVKISEDSMSLDDLIEKSRGQGRRIVRNSSRAPKEEEVVKISEDSMSLDDLIEKSRGQGRRIVRNSSRAPKEEGVVKISEDSMSLDELLETSRGRGRRSFNRASIERQPPPPPSAANKVDAYDYATIFTENGCGRRRSFAGRERSNNSTGLTVKLNKAVDPMSVSLDDLIVQENEENRDRGFKRRSNGRSRQENGLEGLMMDVDDDAGESVAMKRPRLAPRTTTPYRAVEFLSGKGMIIHVKIGKLVEENNDIAHLWRCEIKCGDISGMAESSRKAVAREISAREFLRRLGEVYPEGQVPKTMIPEELYLDPKVFKKVDELAEERGLSISENVKIIEGEPDRRGMSKPWFKCTFTVDGDEVSGESDDLDYAKLEAGGKAYTLITGNAFPKTSYFVGQDIMIDYEFTYYESEVYYSEEDQTNALEDTAAVVGGIEAGEKSEP